MIYKANFFHAVFLKFLPDTVKCLKANNLVT